MSGAALLTLLLALPDAAAAQGDAAASASAFVEVAADPATLFVGQPLRLTVRFGFTPEFLRDHVVPLFAQPLDVAVQLELPWLATPEALAGAKARETAPSAATEKPLRCALNDGVATVRRAAAERRDGRDFTVFELARDFLPERAGTLAIPAPALRFAWASRFDDDLLRGRVALDQRVAVVDGKPLALAVVALPEAGRPAAFGGAVGSFTIRAELAPRATPDERSLRLVVTIEGSGNLEAFATPKFPELERFHRLGTLESKTTTRRTLTCDLRSPGATATQVPALTFTFFDPKPPVGYRTIRSEAIALPAASDGGATTTAGAPDSASPSDASPTSSRGAIAAALAAVVIFALVVARQRRRRLEQSADPAAARARTAATTFAERARDPDADLAAALADYLAARLATTAAAVIAPELPARLRARGIAPELAERTATRLRALVAARYGAGGAAPTQPIPTLVRELEAAFAAADADRSAAPPRR